MENFNVVVRDHIKAPVAQVYDAIIDPAKITGYFVGEVSGPLAEGKSIDWNFVDYGVSCRVDVDKIEKDRLIQFEWEGSGRRAGVRIELTQEEDGVTQIHITESSFPYTEEGVRQAMGQTQGWTDFACSLKAYIYTGINLRKGRKNPDKLS